MQYKPGQVTAEPIREDELASFLLWFFADTGYAMHVDTWRALTRAPRDLHDGAGAGDGR